jgi:hypothetical protein
MLECAIFTVTIPPHMKKNFNPIITHTKGYVHSRLCGVRIFCAGQGTVGTTIKQRGGEPGGSSCHGSSIHSLLEG